MSPPSASGCFPAWNGGAQLRRDDELIIARVDVRLPAGKGEAQLRLLEVGDVLPLDLEAVSLTGGVGFNYGFSICANCTALGLSLPAGRKSPFFCPIRPQYA